MKAHQSGRILASILAIAIISLLLAVTLRINMQDEWAAATAEEDPRPNVEAIIWTGILESVQEFLFQTPDSPS